MFQLSDWILHRISSRVTHLSPSWALSLLCCCFGHPHTCGMELLCPAVYGDGHGGEHGLNGDGSGDHPSANMHEPWTGDPGGDFPPLQPWDLSISVNICPALHPALQLLYFSLVTKLMQVCRISPYGWQGWDDAAELQSSSVGRRAHHQGCPWSWDSPMPGTGAMSCSTSLAVTPGWGCSGSNPVSAFASLSSAWT